MQRIDGYKLFLFDFDGLLVDTEHIHYEAYQEMCKRRGYELPLDFLQYCAIAHYTSAGLEEVVYQNCPGLKAEEPHWDVLYKEKTAIYYDKLEKGAISLMPGVEEFLEKIKGAPSCVVTHSARFLVQAIRKKNPLLNTIPFWITREDYERPKPYPDAYQTAIQRFGEKERAIIGFEDTPRGIAALQGTHAQPVLITSMDYPEIPSLKKKGVLHFLNFHDVNITL